MNESQLFRFLLNYIFSAQAMGKFLGVGIYLMLKKFATKLNRLQTAVAVAFRFTCY